MFRFNGLAIAKRKPVRLGPHRVALFGKSGESRAITEGRLTRAAADASGVVRVARTGAGFYLTEYLGICLLGIFSESESIAGVLNWGAGLVIAVLPAGKPPNGEPCDGRSGSRLNGASPY